MSLQVNVAMREHSALHHTDFRGEQKPPTLPLPTPPKPTFDPSYTFLITCIVRYETISSSTMAIKKQTGPSSNLSGHSLRKTEARQANSNHPSTTHATGKRARLSHSKKTPTATATKSSCRKRLPVGEREFKYIHQKDYRAAAGDRLDDEKALEDKKAVLAAQKRSLAHLQSLFPPSSSQAEPIIDDPVLTGILGLARSKPEQETYLSKMEQRSIAKLDTDYPEFDAFASESMETTRHWDSTWYYTALADARRKTRERPIVIQLDRSEMTLLPSNQSVIFYDSEQPDKPVLFVKRGFVQDERVRTAIGIMAVTAVIERRSERVPLPLFPQPAETTRYRETIPVE